MKNILIIAQGSLAKHFLKKLSLNKLATHHYTVVSKDDESIPNITSENFSFYKFDATSFSKLNAILNGYFSQFILLVDDKLESVEIYKNLRKISKKTDIVLLNLWEKYDDELENDRHTEAINLNEMIATNFIHHLPDTPVIADNIGLGEGEIMEVQVPVGSSYMYRHLSSVQQKKWRIALIYRSNEIILPKPNVMIRPNDTLLIVGDPNVLRNVFRSVKREKGQFPSPFGNNIYTFLDMKLMSKQRVAKLIEDSLYIHSKLNNKRLIFKVVNATLGKNLRLLRAIDDKNILVKFDYYTHDNSHIMGDVANFDIGLVLTDNDYFFKFKKLFHSLNLPILKVGDESIKSIEQGVILGNGNESIEDRSAVILDCCSQLGIDMKFYYFDNKNGDKDTLAEHFESISELFDKNIDMQNCEDVNPLVKLSSEKNLLHFVSFDSEISGKDAFAFVSTSLNRQYKILRSNSQLFVPVSS